MACAAIVLGLAAQSGAAAPTRGQSAVAQVASATTATATFATNPGPGNTILVFVQTNGAINSVVDNGSTPKTFTRDAFTTAGKGAYIYRANDITLPASGSYKVTVTASAARTIQAKAIEFAGLAPGPPSATNAGSGTGTAVSTGSVTSGGDAVFFGGFSDNSGQNPQGITFKSAGDGFVQDFVNSNGAAYWPAAQASAIASGPATKSISWTIGSSSAWGAVIAVYPVGAGTGGDTTPPDTAISSGPPNPSTSSSAGFSFTGTDDGTPTTSLTYECKLDAETFAACNSPKSYSGLSDGSHTFEVRAKDAAGNVDPTPASQTWQINAQSGAAAPTRGQSAVAQVASATTATATFATNPGPGNTILVFVQTNGAINSVVDNGSTPKTFTRDAFTTAGKGAYIYRANDITLPASGSYKVTVTASAARTIQAKAIEFAGLAPGPPSATNAGSGTGTAVSTGSVTSGGDAVFFGGFSDNSGQNPQGITFKSAGDGFVQDFVNSNGAAYWPAAQASAIASGPATKSISWTIGSSSAWGAVIAVYPVGAGTGGDTTPPPRTDELPDLGMGRVSAFSIDKTTMPGHTLLRFTAVIANVGAGPFEVYGSRPSTSDPNRSVEQRIYQTTGDYRSSPTDAVMYYAGDGHNHWHLKNLEGAQLIDTSGNPVGAYAKIGFCFSDNAIYGSSIPGTPSTAAYSGCANNQPDALNVRAGLSIGWGDWYPASMAFQWIDITGVPYGNYRFWAFADPHGFFLEKSNTNNSTWTDVSYDSSGVRPIAYGPHARREGWRQGSGRRCGYRTTGKRSRRPGVLTHGSAACWAGITRPLGIRLHDVRTRPKVRANAWLGSRFARSGLLAVCHLRAAGSPDPKSAAPEHRPTVQ